MARLAIKFEASADPVEVFAKTGTVFNSWNLKRNDGLIKTLTFEHLQDAARRVNFTTFDIVGLIALEPMVPGTIPTYGELADATFDGVSWIIPITGTVPNMLDLTGPQWMTLIKGLPAGMRTTLRDARNAAWTAAEGASDGLSDAAYLALQDAGEAASFLSDRQVDKPYDETLEALALIGVVPTAPQLVSFDARWIAVSAL